MSLTDGTMKEEIEVVFSSGTTVNPSVLGFVITSSVGLSSSTSSSCVKSTLSLPVAAFTGKVLPEKLLATANVNATAKYLTFISTPPYQSIPKLHYLLYLLTHCQTVRAAVTWHHSIYHIDKPC